MKTKTTIPFLAMAATALGALSAMGSVKTGPQEPATEAPAFSLNTESVPFFWDGEALLPTSWKSNAAEWTDIGDLDYPDQSILAGFFQASHVDLGHAASSETRSEFFWLPEALWRTPRLLDEREYLPPAGKGIPFPIVLPEGESIYLDLHHPDVLSVLDGWQITGRGDIQRG